MLQQIRINHIVGIHKEHILSSHMRETGVACVAEAAVFGQMQYGHTLVFFDPRIANFRRIIRRTVINQNDFKIIKSLCSHTLQRLFQIIRNAVYGHHDAEKRSCLIHLQPPLSAGLQLSKKLCITGLYLGNNATFKIRQPSAVHFKRHKHELHIG